MTDVTDRITKPTKAKPIAPAAPVYDDTPAVRLEYPRLVKRPKVAPAPRGVTTTVTLSPPTEAKPAAARGGLIKTKPIKPKAIKHTKAKPR